MMKAKIPIRSRSTVAAVALALATTASPAVAQSERDLEQRVNALERRLDSGALTRMINQFGGLEDEIRSLNGRIDELSRRVQELEERQRKIYQDVDMRLLELEDNGGDASGEAVAPPSAPSDTQTPPEDSSGQADNAAGEGTGGSGTPDAGTTVADTGEGGDDAEAAYESAFETLRAGEYEDANEAFTAFLERHPDSEYADNARYWLGESHYVVREFDQALTEFQRVLDDYDDSGKRPDALLKIGYIHYERGRLTQARETLREVVQAYPDSSAASLARQRLEQIDG